MTALDATLARLGACPETRGWAASQPDLAPHEVLQQPRVVVGQHERHGPHRSPPASNTPAHHRTTIVGPHASTHASTAQQPRATPCGSAAAQTSSRPSRQAHAATSAGTGSGVVMSARPCTPRAKRSPCARRGKEAARRTISVTRGRRKHRGNEAIIRSALRRKGLRADEKRQK